MTIAIFWFLFSVAVGGWAENKGRSAAGWFLLALILSPVVAGLFLAVSANNVLNIEKEQLTKGDMKRCQHCAEIIKKAAIVCRYCGKDVASNLQDAASTTKYIACRKCGSICEDGAAICSFCRAGIGT